MKKAGVMTAMAVASIVFAGITPALAHVQPALECNVEFSRPQLPAQFPQVSPSPEQRIQGQPVVRRRGVVDELVHQARFPEHLPRVRSRQQRDRC